MHYAKILALIFLDFQWEGVCRYGKKHPPLPQISNMASRPSRIKTLWSVHIRGVASLEGDKVVIYYPSPSEIWPNKRGGFWWD
jgi:hypothetical protein